MKGLEGAAAAANLRAVQAIIEAQQAAMIACHGGVHGGDDLSEHMIYRAAMLCGSSLLIPGRFSSRLAALQSLVLNSSWCGRPEGPAYSPIRYLDL